MVHADVSALSFGLRGDRLSDQSFTGAIPRMQVRLALAISETLIAPEASKRRQVDLTEQRCVPQPGTGLDLKVPCLDAD